MTRNFNRRGLPIFAALALLCTTPALSAVAVLDVGSTSAQAAPSVSPFAGSWSGTWSVFEVGQVVGTGTFDWTISNAGQITGTVYTSTNFGAMVGHVGAGGFLMMIGYVPSNVPSGAFNGIPFQGAALIDGEGKLVVSVTRTDSDRTLVAILERD